MMIRMLMMWSLSEVERCSGINCFIGSEIMSENGTNKSCQMRTQGRQNNKRKRNNRKTLLKETQMGQKECRTCHIRHIKEQRGRDLVPDLVTEVRAD